MQRFICIHAHFYQPPRENPWLEAIERQESAYPYHDWNERINAECYAPNGASRILSTDGRIRDIVNNYSKISFNFGPTLLSWMKDRAPKTYAAVLEADRTSQERFSGHGSALAQAYNHIILPLANARDRYTQILWGIRDFEHRFGRFPEGVWLPETAVDYETLDILAELGIQFTILAPRQAGKTRKIGGRSWKDVSGGRIDPSQAYQARLPSGRKIGIFFYDGPISQAVAFEDLLASGEQFAERLQQGFLSTRPWTQLVHIATDGETYGHHHRFGDMALAFALNRIESSGDTTLTNYGEFLKAFPPTHEVQILENTSWSCSHGIERWRSNCGCNSGHAGWNQEWRAPLRAALDYVRDRAAHLFEVQAAPLLQDPWDARNDYISAVLDRSKESLWLFFEKHSGRQLNPEEITKALKLLEMQRHAMLMFTSCGWFFDELSGLETVQVIQYAARTIQLAKETSGEDLEPEFLHLLAEAKSNVAELGDGARIYNAKVKPTIQDLEMVGAHFAISSAFEGWNDTSRFCYEIGTEDYRRFSSTASKLALGKIRVNSQITHESRDLTFGVIHLGDLILHAGVRDARTDDAFRAAMENIVSTFNDDDFQTALRLLKEQFNGMPYSFKSLFRDEQTRILNLVLRRTLEEAESSYQGVYQRFEPLLHFLREMQQPIPEVLRITAEFVLNLDLKRTLDAEPVDSAHLIPMLERVQQEGVRLEEAGLNFAASASLTKLLLQIQREPTNWNVIQQANVFVDALQRFQFPVNYWEPQNILYSTIKSIFPSSAGAQAHTGLQQDLSAETDWQRGLLSLGEKLRLDVSLKETDRELQIAS
ncbi:MAG TPA: DUF3536 domain-containing protein [Candidatus Angelobacter sp.]|nr:DUF3536 domain-containing protein [Candidatus Angelobacter sp.]